MDTAAILIERLEAATHRVADSEPFGGAEGLDARDRAISSLAAQPALRISPEQFARLRVLFEDGAALVERARAARAAVLMDLQDSAAARGYASALQPGNGPAHPVVDMTL